MEAINSVVSKAVAAIDDIPPSIIPKDNNDSGIFEPVVEALFFGIPTIPQGVTYGQSRSGRNIRNPMDRQKDILPTGNARVHGLGS